MNKKIRNLGISIVSLTIISLILSIWVENSFRIVFGSIYVLFLPGYTISYLFFKKIDIIERIALSFALSIAVVPLVIFYLNLVGMKISALSSFITITAIILAAFTIRLYKR